MLDSYGKLTDIGSWYLGGNATGVVPNDTIVKPDRIIPSSPTPTYTVPALVTGDSDSLGATTRSLPLLLASLWQFIAVLVII